MQKKLLAAIHRGYFKTADLFAGCGGLSLGFHRAGFKCVSAVEIDDHARASHALNFERLVGPGQYAGHSDVTAISPKEAVSHLTDLFTPADQAVDVIVGGPPCQAFSRLGRARLWELSGKKNGHAHDDRATMYEHYLEYVAQLKPLAFVMENVREIGKFVGRNVAEEIALTAEDLGYEVRYTLLNAVWFGVPQLRERAFIIGIHKDLGVSPDFPEITHKYDLPHGYSTSRSGNGKVDFLPPHDHAIDHHGRAKRLKSAVTVEKAFTDLPAIQYHLDGREGKGVPRDPNTISEYSNRGTTYPKIMRNWPEFKNTGSTFTGHVIRYTPRDYEIFRRMPNGGMYPEAHTTAMEIFAERIAIAEKELGKTIGKGSEKWEEILKKTVPPYPTNKYPNKFRKMWANHPARTLPAHLGKDSYSHIHFDSDQARCISVREAARLQSFPDGFRFSGSMNPSLKQIGNAVPPLLAYAVAGSLKNCLNDALAKKNKAELANEHRD